MTIGISILVALAVILIFLMFKKKYSFFTNPCFIFVLEWLVIIALSNMRLFGLYEPSFNAYLIIILGVISFVLGYYVLNKVKLKSSTKRKKDKTFTIRYKLLYILGIICTIYFMFSAINMLGNFTNGDLSFNAIRESAQSSGETNAAIRFIYNFIVLPASYVLEIVTVADIFRGKKDKKLIVLTVLTILLKTIADGGRSFLLNFIIYIFLAYRLTGKTNLVKKIGIKRKAVKRLLIGVSILLAFFLIITIQRSPSGIFRISYLYFSMPPVMLDWWSNAVNSAGGYWFGLVCMNGILFAIFYIIKNFLGLIDYPSFVKGPYDLISSTDSQWISINDNGTKANAYVTMFWFFYADFGHIGVALGCLLYGLIVRKIYDYEKERRDVRSLSFYLLIFWTLLYSFVRFQFAKSSVVIAALLLFLSFRQIEDKNANQSKIDRVGEGE